MLLRLLALLFASLALVLGLSVGWAWPLGAMITRVNPTALPTLQNLVGGVLWQQLWDLLVQPALSSPAWLASAVLALVLYAIAIVRPGHG